jgi:hypothetical protein
MALFLAYDVHTLILRALVPDFDTVAVLLVVLPLALVSGSLGIDVSPGAIRFVVAPLAFIDVAVDVIEFSMAESLPITPLSFVDCAIRPTHGAASMAEPTEPLSVVHGLILVLIGLNIGFLICLKGAMQCLLGLFVSEVFALLLY